MMRPALSRPTSFFLSPALRSRGFSTKSEKAVYEVPERLKNSAHIRSMEVYKKMYEESLNSPEAFWGAAAREHLTWFRLFERVMSGGLERGDVAWFLQGQLNAAYNCVDRHAAARPDDTAILWEGDRPGDVRRISFRQLFEDVCRLANVLRDRCGVRKGDRVGIYMPMVPEAAVAMLACARLGAVHSVVFAGFSAEALRERLQNAEAKVLITADEGRRGGKHVPLKMLADEALLAAPLVQRCLVYRHTGARVPWHPSRDLDLREAMQQARPYCPAEPVDAEDPLFLLYTSGSTGAPKGLLHTTGGYLLYAALTHRYVFDWHPGDRYACVADVGWITGHTYIVYGPLCNGASTFMFESLPTYPDAGRYWDLVQRHRLTHFYTAPTALRTLMAQGDEPVRRYDRSSLRVLGSVGEPINPEAWRWYHDVVGEGRCALVDTYWQTETGGVVIAPLPGAVRTKPGAATLPFFGIEPVLLDAASGRELQGPASGLLAFRRSWPGIARSVFGDHARYLKTYLQPYPGFYFTGDGATRDEDGYLWITGRVDDVINKAGHRLGSAEIESALVNHPACAEAAVIGVADPIKGEAIWAFVTLREGYSEKEKTLQDLRLEVRRRIGAIAAPDQVIVTPNLPKTRSGKIMRRLLRKLAQGETRDFGDTSTLADPAVVELLIQKVRDLHK